MLLPRILPLSFLMISLLQISYCSETPSQESGEKAVNDASFEKRQGIADEVPDQLAVESGHQDQVDASSSAQQFSNNGQQQVPLPVSVQAFPGNVVLPMPPGFGQGPPPPGAQLRGPIPHGGPHGPGPQGQFSNPQPNHQLPPQAQFQQQGPPHQQQFPHQGPPHQGPPQHGPPQHGPQQHGPPQHGPPQHGPPHHGPPQQFQGPPHAFPPHGHPQQFHHPQQGPHFNPQNIHQQSLQDQLRQKLPPGSDILVQKANEVLPLGQQSQESQISQINLSPSLEQQQFQHQQHMHLLQLQQQQQQQQQNNLAQAQLQAHAQSQGNSNEDDQTQIHPNHKNTGLVPPPPPKFERERPQHFREHRPGFNSGESLTKNILRELFNRPKPHHDRPGPPHHGKPDAPNGGYFGPPPPGPSHPKVLNRPGPGGNRPGPGGITNGKEIALSNDLNAEGGEVGPIIQYGGPLGANPAGPWPEGPDGDMPKIVSLEVKCEKNVMRVFVAFDKPFFGVIFSKGHYHNVHCVHLPAGLGHTSANFDIGIDACGTQGNTENGLYGYGVQSGSGSYFENTIVVQYDSQVQEVWDQARKLRCTWHDQYEKSVTFRPFPVDMLKVVRADFAGDNVGCWMQIQVGKGPWASEVSGLVKIGQTMTMVLAIKDDENKFDMLVRNCMAHDGNRAPIQLVDQFGCVTRPKLMSRFTKIKNFGNSASVLSYAHFQAFKFPDSMEVHFQCTIQICRHQCPEQCVQPGGAGALGGAYGIGKSGIAAEASESTERRPNGERQEAAAARRKRRSPSLNATTTEADLPEDSFEYTTTFKAEINNQKEDVGLNRVITVVSPDDLDFANKQGSQTNEEGVPLVEASVGDIVCMSTFGFAAMLVLLIGMLLIACVVSAVIILKRPMKKNY